MNPFKRWLSTALTWVYQKTGLPIPQELLIAEMDRRIDDSKQVLTGLTRQLYAGDIDILTWKAAVAAELKDAHIAFAAFASGGVNRVTALQWYRVSDTLAKEYGYLQQFADKIAAGRMSEAQAIANIKQYANAARQEYWDQYELSTPSEGYVIYWDRYASESCTDCVELSNKSPYLPGELEQVPGDGRTRCHGYCQCQLRRKKV